ncbi:MAG: hypothetical protein K8J31_30715 [Anaerolineae bacterium]|nr:hypothetical protein [Anaerolineae bacterium]
MFYDNIVASDQLARERHQAILREVEQIRFANQFASKSPSRPHRVAQNLLTALLTVFQQ